MLKILSIIILILASCTNDQIKSHIEPIKSFNEVNFDKINYSDNTLVIFDVDETLVQPLESYLINEHNPKGNEFRTNFAKKNPHIKDWDYLMSIILKGAKRPLIEEGVIEKIKGL